MNNIINLYDKASELRPVLAMFMVEVMRYDSADTLRLLKREDLSMPRVAALSFVERRGAVTISEISTWLGMSLANTSMVVDKLVCQGFVTRAEDENDRRHKRIQLTEKGHALVRELQVTRVNSAVQRMLHLPPELLDRAIDVLSEVTTELSHISTDSGADQTQEA